MKLILKWGYYFGPFILWKLTLLWLRVFKKTWLSRKKFHDVKKSFILLAKRHGSLSWNKVSCLRQGILTKWTTSVLTRVRVWRPRRPDTSIETSLDCRHPTPGGISSALKSSVSAFIHVQNVPLELWKGNQTIFL